MTLLQIKLLLFASTIATGLFNGLLDTKGAVILTAVYFLIYKSFLISSYLLNNFWFTRIQVIKTMIIDQILYFGFLVSLLLIINLFKVAVYTAAFSLVLLYQYIINNLISEFYNITLIVLFLFIGAINQTTQLWINIVLSDTKKSFVSSSYTFIYFLLKNLLLFFKFLVILSLSSMNATSLEPIESINSTEVEIESNVLEKKTENSSDEEDYFLYILATPLILLVVAVCYTYSRDPKIPPKTIPWDPWDLMDRWSYSDTEPRLVLDFIDILWHVFEFVIMYF